MDVQNGWIICRYLHGNQTESGHLEDKEGDEITLRKRSVNGSWMLLAEIRVQCGWVWVLAVSNPQFLLPEG